MLHRNTSSIDTLLHCLKTSNVLTGQVNIKRKTPF